MLQFETSDKVIIQVEKNVMKCSSLLNSMFEVIEFDDEVIPLESIRADIFNLVVAWAVHHRNDAIVSEEAPTIFGFSVTESLTPLEERLANIDEWDKKFVDIDHNTIYELIQAADFLCIKKLLNLLTLHLIGIINGKSSAEIREAFGIEDDMPKE